MESIQNRAKTAKQNTSSLHSHSVTAMYCKPPDNLKCHPVAIYNHIHQPEVKLINCRKQKEDNTCFKLGEYRANEDDADLGDC